MRASHYVDSRCAFGCLLGALHASTQFCQRSASRVAALELRKSTHLLRVERRKTNVGFRQRPGYPVLVPVNNLQYRQLRCCASEPPNSAKPGKDAQPPEESEQQFFSEEFQRRMSDEFRAALEAEFDREDPLEESIRNAFCREERPPQEPGPPKTYQLYDPDEVVAELDRLAASGAFDVSEYGDADTFWERYVKNRSASASQDGDTTQTDTDVGRDASIWELDLEHLDDSSSAEGPDAAGTPGTQALLQLPCPGCGAHLQDDDPDAPGYLPARALRPKGQNAEKPLTSKVCQRCFHLTHYSKISAKGLTLMSPEQFREILAPLAKQRAVVVCMLDILDLSSSMLKEVSQLANAQSPLLVVINKADLLPSSVKLGHIMQWIWKRCAASGMRRRPRAVYLISAERGLGIRGFVQGLVAAARESRTDHIYIMGAANVGKSTLLNRIIRGHPGHGSKPTRELTTSVVPGTTLGMVRLPLKNAATGERIVIMDTPGIVEPRRVNLLCLEDISEMKGILPRRRLRGITYRLEQGKSLWLGGLVNIALAEGKPWFFTAYVSEQVTVHVSDASKALNETYRVQSVKNGLLWPGGLRVPLATVEPVRMCVEHGTWKRTCADIVIPGLGWVALLGSGSCTVHVRVAGGGTVWKQEPLAPRALAELRTERYFGAPRQVLRNTKASS
jgi:ribosome biogenesis GTPase A